MTKLLSMPTLGEALDRCEQVGNCLEWKGIYSTNGYPIYSIGKTRRLHMRKVVFNLARDQPCMAPVVADGAPARVSMKCLNKRCLNPAHMVATSESALQKMAAERGSYSTPARVAAVTAGIRAKRKTLKLDLQAAQEIIADPRRAEEIAAERGISRSLVLRIKRRELWREATPNASVFHLAG